MSLKQAIQSLWSCTAGREVITALYSGPKNRQTSTRWSSTINAGPGSHRECRRISRFTKLAGFPESVLE
jgi:hypothetical protein